MENEKVLIAGGLLVGAYLLFGGKKKTTLPSGASDEDAASQLAENLDHQLEMDADELADLSESNGNGLDLDDPGDLEEYYEEEIKEKAKALADNLTSISASGGGGGGGGGGGEEKNVNWCGRMITAAQESAYLSQMLARNGPDGKYEEDPKGSNCWKWVPTKKRPPENGNGNGNGNGRGEEGKEGPAGVGPLPSVATGSGWSTGKAPVQTGTPEGYYTGYQGPAGVDPMSFSGGFY